MNVPIEIAAKVRGKKLGDSFKISDENERLKVYEAVRVLKRAGIINFVVQTKALETGGFHAVCVPE